ncbi:MAG: DNA mismatch repair endonuclease MutL [Pseudomonadota bacterium]
MALQEWQNTPAVRRLDDALADKIAAGEVVERPASVVKELVENAIDAGAQHIDIAVEGGGAHLIRVADDGHGIAADDLALAVSRHCTSKLATAADLDAIVTMGFRGEALPSIGAVARLTVASRAADAADGAVIAVEAGRAGPVRPGGRAIGTTVEVRDLFFATPARLKFMKGEKTEMAAITDTVKRLALSSPSVAFTLQGNGRPLRYAQGSAQDRARDVLGASFADEAIALAAERDRVRLSGLLGLPTNGRANSLYQYAFVNGRVVRDKLIAQAMRAGYQDVMPRDRYPMAVVHIEIAPDAVDVNVHPQKADVRFSDPQLVRGLIVSAIRRQLATDGTRTSRAVSNAAIAAVSVPSGPPGLSEAPSRFSRPAARRAAPVPVVRPGRPDQSAFTAEPSVRPSEPASAELASRPMGAAIAQVFKNYIIAQSDSGILVVDQHAAHERIVYEALKTAAAAKETPAAQGLLIPEVVDLPPEDVARLDDHKEMFATFGLSLEPFGPGAVAVRETPAILGTFDVAALVRQLADEIAEWGSADGLASRLDHVAATMACHGSVRSGRILNQAEMNALLRQIETTPSAAQCNHGRPTFVSLTQRDLERLFERR